MNPFRKLALPALAALLALGLSACAPEIGSDAWCANMKAKGDWSANEAVDFAKHCILK